MIVTLVHVPGTELAGDIDNIAKPILDTLGRHVYSGDRQIERALVLWIMPRLLGTGWKVLQ